MNNNFWGEPDDVEPLPDWMRPNAKKNNKSLTEVIQETLEKPPIPMIPDEPASNP
jgi:hypothetical protein